MAQIYRYQDAQGKDILVSDFSQVPQQFRESVQQVVVRTREPVTSTSAGAGGKVTTFVKSLDLPSIGVGGAFGLLVAIVLSFALRKGRWVLKVGLIAVAVLVLGGSYLGWVRRSAGLGGGALSNPSEILEDARKAARQMSQRQLEQGVLEEIDKAAE